MKCVVIDSICFLRSNISTIYVHPLTLEEHIIELSDENDRFWKGLTGTDYSSYIYFDVLNVTYENINFLFETILNIKIKENLAIIL